MTKMKFVERNYSISTKRICNVSIPFLFLGFLGFLILLYDGNVLKALKIFLFTLVALMVLIPFMFFPIINLFMFSWLKPYHKFIGNMIGISGDEITLNLTFFIALVYTGLSFLILISTIYLIAYNLAEEKRAEKLVKHLFSRFSWVKPKKR